MRRRRRSSFSSSSDGMGTVRWLQPAGIRRRPRRRPPVIPILLLLVVLAGAAGTGYVLLAREAAGDRRQEVVERFIAAWEKRDYPAMWRLISPERRRDWPMAEFASSYRIAAAAGERQVGPGARWARSPSRGPRRSACACARATSGSCAAPCRCGSSSATASPTWTGRRPGACPACATARTSAAGCSSARRGARSWPPTAAGSRPSRRWRTIIGTAPAGGEPGSGLQALYDERLGGRPGAELRYRQAADRARRRSSAAARCAPRSRRACSASPTARSATASAASR